MTIVLLVPDLHLHVAREIDKTMSFDRHWCISSPYNSTGVCSLAVDVAQVLRTLEGTDKL